MAAPQGYRLWFIHVSLPSIWSKFSPIGEHIGEWASGKWMNKWTKAVFIFSNIFEHDVFIICLITQHCPVCKLLQTLWTIERFGGIKDKRIEVVMKCVGIWMLYMYMNMNVVWEKETLFSWPLSCVRLYNPMDCSPPGSFVHGDSPDKNTGVGCHFLL